MPQNEKSQSQIPAIKLLINSGYKILSPEEVNRERQGKKSNIILESILEKQLKKINRINFKGQEYLFSEENIQSAIQTLKNPQYDGLVKTSEKIYDLLTLGTSLKQSIEGNNRSYDLYYIDWKDFSNNVFHVVPEFEIEKTRSLELKRPDIVLFINGIPFAVIEAKVPDNTEKDSLKDAIEQHLENQWEENIPRLFIYTQLLIAISKNDFAYATTGTPKKFWSKWKELKGDDKQVSKLINRKLNKKDEEILFSYRDFKTEKEFFSNLENAGERLVTEQDKNLYALCSPERLLDLSYGFIVFDAGLKKIARYQQYFVVKSSLRRIKTKDHTDKRKGGVIWHTQGSGKSLTMVMLARAIINDSEIEKQQIILVTDREDLDKQLGNTFHACGLEKARASSARNLIKHIKDGKQIITTLVHKFDRAFSATQFKNESNDIFVLVDESHRTQFGSFAASMRAMLPNASYIAFTGTPLLKTEKNNFSKFGDLIEPHYSIRQAVDDGAVLPLLYEGRHVNIEQNDKAIDLWFERHTANLSEKEKADLKRKYSKAKTLNETDQVIYMRAFDIAEHFKRNWQGTGFKAQLVSPSKKAAIKYKKYLEEIGDINTEIIMSAPNLREGIQDVDSEPDSPEAKFWTTMMKRYGTEIQYLESIIESFKKSDEPEILIVIDKLLTGFDAPRNTVLYLCRSLKEHTLLQAIARVNRLYEDEERGITKDFGYIVDYESILGNLDQALEVYDAFQGFEKKDVSEALKGVDSEIHFLAARHQDLLGIFKTITNPYDDEAYEVLLADEELRDDFYQCFYAFSKTLATALATSKFMENTCQEKIAEYKKDLKRFDKLKKTVKHRYADAVDYRDYEPKIKKLLDTHIQASEVTQLNEPVDIFNDETFNDLKEAQGIYSDKSYASRADTIAHATKKTITEKMEEDPVFYENFSTLIQQAIDDFKAKRITDLKYFERISEIREAVKNKKRNDVPEAIADDDEACALFALIKKLFKETNVSIIDDELNLLALNFAKRIQFIFNQYWKVDFWNDEDSKKFVENDIDDYLFDELKDKYSLSLDDIDEIISKLMQLMRSRRK